MEIVIDIPDQKYKWIVDNPQAYTDDLQEAIRNGTPLPEHHGDLIERNELLDYSYEIDSMYCMYDEVVNVDDIKNAPAIIEGSEGEK